MKTLMFTAWNEKYDPLATLTVPLMGHYATLRRFDFDEITEPTFKTQDGIYWEKFVAALNYLKVYDRVIWLDCDIMITNPDFDLAKYFTNFRHGIHVPHDWGFDATDPNDVSACAVVMHLDCVPILKEIIALEPESRGKEFPEQTPMRQVLKKHRGSLGPVYYNSRKPFNCVPEEVCPGKVPEPWAKGDFTCHLTMLPVEKRIELFHEIKKQAGI